MTLIRPRTRPKPVTSTARPVAVLGAVLVTVLVAGLVVGCGGPPHPTLAELHQVPGSRLSYPAAKIATRQETQSQHGVDGASPAMILVEACAPATAGQILDWYGRQLVAAGWRPQQGVTGVSDPTEFVSDHTWRHGDYSFDVLIGTPAQTTRLSAQVTPGAGCGQAFRTIAQ